MATENKMLVKLGSMVNPRTFWATELPNDATLAPNGKHSKILKIEENLSNIVSHNFSNTDRFINLGTELGSLVAVRKSSLSSLWFRGRLEQICEIDTQLVAKIFLIDYGEVLDKTDVFSCVRKLPVCVGLTMQKQLAFQIVLRALAPITQDLDFQSGVNKMGTVIARSFDFAAVSFTSRLLNASTMCAELHDFVSDFQGRLHGQLYIQKHDELVHLNEVLIEAKFAEESEEQFQKDLAELASVSMPSTKVKVQLSDSEEDFDTTSASCPDLKWFEKVDMNDEAALDKSISQIPTSVGDWSDTSGLGRGKRLQKYPDTNMGIGTISKSTKPHAVEPKGRLAYLRKLVENKNTKVSSSKNTSKTAPVETKQQEMVRKFREQLKVKYSEEDEFSLWNDLKKDPSEMKGRTYLLPGGVLKGKFHEALLQNIPQGSVPGPRTREALAQFVCSRGLNSTVPDVSTRQKVGLDLEEQINQGNFQ